MLKNLGLLLAIALLGVSCRPETPKSEPSGRGEPPVKNLQTFAVKGVVVELEADGKTVNIRHEEIPGYMAAMTMPFEVLDANELNGLEAGDSVAFRLVVTDDDAWIDQVKKLDAPKARPTVRVTRDVEALEIGDPLPEYRFTNQLGQPFTTAQFKGQALAITFIFTRCPLPTFCPRMTSSFADAQKLLLSDPQSPTNWHLLTLSFDPEFDTPAVLRAYTNAQGADPQRWTFATGALIDVTAITEQFGLQFWREPDDVAFSHNLRTAVIDASGRLQRILPGNQWTGAELAAEIVKAARK